MLIRRLFESLAPGCAALALLAGFLAAMSVVALNYYARSGAEIIGQAPEDQPRPQSPVPAVSR